MPDTLSVTARVGIERKQLITQEVELTHEEWRAVKLSMNKDFIFELIDEDDPTYVEHKATKVINFVKVLST